MKRVARYFEQTYFKSFQNLLRRQYCSHMSFFDFSIRLVKKNIPTMILFFKNDWFHRFVMAIDIIAYDQPGKLYRFTVIYYLLSLVLNSRVQVITQLDNLHGLETIALIYKSTNWSEREMWDMYGIFILLHPELRRILTDYGFTGYPLRKDFPLTGYVELIYSEIVKNPVYKKVELTQEFRTYFYYNPWIEKLLYEKQKLFIVTNNH